MAEEIILSFCVPIYNEAEILIPQIGKIKKNLEKIIGSNQFEILIIDNGSIDNTPVILKQIHDTSIRIFRLPSRGHGLAYKKGLQHAKGQWIVLSAIDLPFGFEDLRKAKKLWKDYDIIYGSKSHPGSIILVPFSRKVASSFYNLFLRLLLGNTISDTQGSVFIRRTAFTKISSHCTAKNAFFTAQIAIYGKKANAKIAEVPVKYNAILGRKSKYKIFRDGAEMFSSIIREVFLLQTPQR